MTFSRLKEGIRMIQAGFGMSEDTASNEHGSKTNIQGIMKLSACYEEVLKGTKILCLVKFQSSINLSHLQELVNYYLHIWPSKMATKMTYRYLVLRRKYDHEKKK